MSNTMNYRK